MFRRREKHKKSEVYRYWTKRNLEIVKKRGLLSAETEKSKTEILERRGKTISDHAPSESLSHSKKSFFLPKPLMSLTADGIRRAKRILERLQREKFILKPNLFRWLVNLEKGKGMTMGTKTVDEILNRLQQEGLCRCIEMNFGNKQLIKVVLHPHIVNMSVELCNEIAEKMRSTEKQRNGPISSEKLENMINPKRKLEQESAERTDTREPTSLKRSKHDITGSPSKSRSTRSFDEAEKFEANTLKLKVACQGRQLVMQYVRYHAAKGANFRATEWSLIPDLPATPRRCLKRMASLKLNFNFREALMQLCNMLSERFVKHLEENQKFTGMERPRWDDFNDKNIKAALEMVLQHKQGGKCKISRDRYMDTQKKTRDEKKDIKIRNERKGTSGRVYESVAIANAVELLKLVLLSTSTAKDELSLSAKILSRYTEDELLAAYSYLREKKFVSGGDGDGDSPILLSQAFLRNISRSKFPAVRVERAAKFSHWLQDREMDLIKGEELPIGPDLHCGDLLHLFALVSSQELLVSPRLPSEGVGDASSTGRSGSEKGTEIQNFLPVKLILRPTRRVRVNKSVPGIFKVVDRASHA
ncbi:hypothetical protein CDL15_Pgr001526 [Punica granatum]|uniref:GTF3C1 extended winged-helix domain-containing protein n=1 Tax=Punica granatum TaxID=22663 RepID=A0A218X4L1_PUNGR|nr:hypothetical protein CDL15_Pgr001526 [Punica granatum]